jgi:GH15 family glucan-1,4-alpha-glucosidase
MIQTAKLDSAYRPIEEYGIIGDCHTAALVSRNGSIDWYCPGRFDAPAVFCRLLDQTKGGYFGLTPEGLFSAERRYVENTNILETIFVNDRSRVRITDFMPVHPRQVSPRGYDVGTSRRILRLIEGLSGEMKLEVLFRPTFDYARGETEIDIVPGIGSMAHRNGHYLSLASPGVDPKFRAEDRGTVRGSLTVGAGDRRCLVLTEADDPDRVLELPHPDSYRRQLERTRLYWEQWADRCTYRGSYRSQILRSALTLKLLVYEPTGAIVAAPTTSLPEEIGGVRNWDYRFAWVRDSAMILFALMNIGYEKEAADFFEWLQKTHQKDPSPDLQVLYRIDGAWDVKETNLDHLEGYRGSRPVRIGNAATKQLQIDVYGEVLAAAYLYFTSGIGRRENDPDSNQAGERVLKKDWPLLRELVNQAAKRWQDPDHSIWEIRGGAQRFLYSRLMCWAALDRGIRLATEYSLKAPLERWKSVRKATRQAILAAGFNKDIGVFTQAFGDTELDSSALLIPKVGFLPATDARVQSTIESIRSNLSVDGLIYRYRTADGLPGREGMFLPCTFWLVDALALGGRFDEAHDLFERVSGYTNDLGLLSEEIDPAGRSFLGNFPQGFTHMALINAAVNLAKANRHGPEVRAETEAERARKAAPAAAEGYSQ